MVLKIETDNVSIIFDWICDTKRLSIEYDTCRYDRE
jgi:hypothetical protein